MTGKISYCKLSIHPGHNGEILLTGMILFIDPYNQISLLPDWVQTVGILMIKKLGLLVSFLLLLGAVTGPSLVSAEMDPLASPTPKPPERVTAPMISGVNPEVELSEGNQGVIILSDILSPLSVQIPILIDPPQYVPNKPRGTFPVEESLPVPLQTQKAGEVTCGPQALGMVLGFKGSAAGDSSPSPDQLISFMKSRGLMYSWGTGVEELVYTTREFGYAGSRAFHNWTLEGLTAVIFSRQMVNILSIPKLILEGSSKS